MLVVGLGPAGFTLAHHLMNDGHTVVGIDGLKIEPLPPRCPASTLTASAHDFKPIRDIAELVENLDDRVMAGFGGVAEYGITVRWDKNFLKLIRLLLERRAEFAMFGGVRFGGTLGIDEAFALGFDHIALCAGAGRPTVIPMIERPGARRAPGLGFPDGAATDRRGQDRQRRQSAVRLPVVVIGGGLTAIDTATESLAYYPVQVEKFLARYETLVAERGEAAVRGRWSEEERAIADEFIAHARAHSRRARRRRSARTASRTSSQLLKLGRRHDRLSPPPDRRAELHAQSRGSREGAGRRHPLCRRA